MLDQTTIRDLVGLDVVDSTGKSIGNVEFVFNDEETGEPEWLGVISGTFRQQRVLVPVEGATGQGLRCRFPGRRSASVAHRGTAKKIGAASSASEAIRSASRRRRSARPTLITA